MRATLTKEYARTVNAAAPSGPMTLDNSSPPTAAARFTVVIPLYDDRGQGERAVDAWLQQRSSATRFQIVILDAGQRELADRIRPRLEADDSLIRCATRNEAALYNLGAAAATAPWLLFTESHVLPESGSVAALLQQLRDGKFDAATLGTSHICRSRFAQVDAHLYAAETPQVRRLGLWRCVGLRGLLINRQVFDDVGQFTESYYRFAETVLAIHLVDRGYQLVELPQVRLAHVDTDNARELLRAMFVGQLGCSRFWDEHPQLAGRYFGGAAAEHCGHWKSLRLTRRLAARAVGLAAQRQLAAAAQVARPVMRDLPAAVASWHGIELWTKTQALLATCRFYLGLAKWRVTRTSVPPPPLLTAYQQMRASFARLGAARYAADRDQCRQRVEPVSNWSCSAEEADVVGFYQSETWCGEKYRWSQPSAALSLPLAAGRYQLQLDIRPTGLLSARRPRFFVDGRPVPSGDVCEADGRVYLNIKCGNWPCLSWRCRPFLPRKQGLPDRRRLGLALISIHASDQASSANHVRRAA